MSKIIPLSEPSFGGNEKKYLNEAIRSGWVASSGVFIEKFQQSLKEYCDTKYAILCSSGTSALHGALKCVGVAEDDEVLVPSLTFIASINAIIYCQAKPVFLDSNDDYCIDAIKIKKFINEQTFFKNGYTFNKKSHKKIKAIVVVHVWGNACELDEISSICKKKNIKIIEDAAEALGTKYINGKFKNKLAGSIGDIGCLSFNGNKVITAGGGGAIICNNKKYATKFGYLINQAKNNDFYFQHDEVGFNYRISNLQAAVGLAQLEQIDKMIHKRKKINNLYRQGLSSKIDKFSIPNSQKFAESNCWLTVLRVKKSLKSNLLKKLNANGVMARPVWKLCHQQKYLRSFQQYGISNSIKLYNETICLPSSASLSSLQINRIIELISE